VKVERTIEKTTALELMTLTSRLKGNTSTMQRSFHPGDVVPNLAFFEKVSQVGSGVAMHESES
jgi:hypothetical protein